MFNKTLSALLAVAGIALTPAAFAEDSAAATADADAAALAAAPAADQAAKTEISDEQIEEFAKVQQQVQAVSQEYQQKMKETKDQTAMTDLASKANNEMVGIVNDSKLSVEEYNQIAMQLSSDQDLQQRYHSKVKN